MHFATSLADRGGEAPETVLAVTHSPVLRAVAVGLGRPDPGEPPYLHGYTLDLSGEGDPTVTPFVPFN